jgi:hypothetical protein
MATGAGKTEHQRVVLSIKDKLEIQDQSAVRPLSSFSSTARIQELIAITPLFHTAHAQKINFDL